VNYKHGMKGTKIYGVWESMKKRCNNPNNKSYKDYGGRGIEYEPKWETFEGFYDDMGSLYSDGLTLERIDVNGHYCKNNCEWIPGSQQSRNRRFATRVVYKGEEHLLVDLYKKLTDPVVSYGTVSIRVKRGWDVDLALTTPVKGAN
jgi:hypothetical protein